MTGSKGWLPAASRRRVRHQPSDPVPPAPGSSPGAETVARAAPPAVIAMFWAAVLIYNLAQGLMYGSSTALFMDITTARVAATQFTAYMALNNLAISFSAFWQGIAIERFGYPVTLGLDAIVGLVGLAILPYIAMGAPRAAERRRDAAHGGLSAPTTLSMS